MATILDAVGGKIPSTVQAESLLPLAQGVGRGYPRAAFASQYELAYVLRAENYKIWVGAKGIPRLYDLAQGERKDVATDRPLASRWLTDALSTFLTYQHLWRQARWGSPTNATAAMATDLESGTARPIAAQ